MNINYKKIFFYNLPAGITIEASFIYPIIIFIIALIITLSFYLHDKIVSNSLSYRDCIYASINYNDKSTSDFTNSNFLETTINLPNRCPVKSLNLRISYSPYSRILLRVSRME